VSADLGTAALERCPRGEPAMEWSPWPRRPRGAAPPRPPSLLLVGGNRHVAAARTDEDSLPVLSCAFAAAARGGALLAAGDVDGNVYLSDASAPGRHERLATWEAAVRGAVFDVRWSPDDRRVLVAGGDATGRVVDVERGRELAVLGGHLGSLKAVRAWDAAAGEA
jgi:WD40 repeat protein